MKTPCDTFLYLLLNVKAICCIIVPWQMFNERLSLFQFKIKEKPKSLENLKN